ncbi:S1C family serine protease [uncultured Clostridium sp.]|uniref:S1C family serine protease n=1 Tax=uncultured Clostridium sp. TaxID=59620 RepID=UPI0025DDA7D9|nr:trypsin-like peptidase domain-containing protein [uncultured Clostridium sp.]
MYNENEHDNRQGSGLGPDHNPDNDLNYTEGAYADSNSSRRPENGYGGYHDSRYTGNAGGPDGRYSGNAGGPDRRYTENADGADRRDGAGQDRKPDRSYIPQEPNRGRRRGGHMAKRFAGIAAAGILFGCVAGGTMAGVNILTERMTQETVQSSEAAALSTQAAAEQPTMAAVPVSTGNDVSAIVDKAMPSVVAINNKMIYTQEDWFFGKQSYEVPSSGSGIIAGQNDSELLIVTNNHVVEGSEELSVTFIDNTTVKAAVKGTDSDSDLAVIAVNLSDIPEETRGKIQPATLGDSDTLKLGQGVVAIGNALGQGQSVTVGYVSALNKEVTIGGVDRTLLQVDAAINPGNSGGALLNMQGEVIGINAAKYADTDVEGIGYAIPISFAKDIIDDLMTKTTKITVDEDQQGYLGIQLQNIDSRMAQAYGMPEGIYVYKIVEGGAAASSDLRERDIITKFDGETVKTGDELQKMLTYYKGGSNVTLTVQSLENGAYVERQVQITLGFKKDSQKQEVQQN